MTGFSGSYEASDVTFVLKEVTARLLDVDAKERYIQSAGGHYSEVLTAEKPPTAAYLALFERQLERLAPRVAGDVLRLARHIAQHRPTGPVTVVSLARAGTPVGVLVHRALSKLLGRESNHYCVSIIRDRGLDLNALAYVCSKHAASSVVFVDGWTGKGVVGRELRASVAQFNGGRVDKVDAALHVLADIGGTAEVCATRDDYLLPSAVLNATVSGLVSRTVLNEQVGPGDFHGCMRLPQLAAWDRSRLFVDTVWAVMAAGGCQDANPAPLGSSSELFAAIEQYQHSHGLASVNLVKPGVGEATRVMLRRKPLLLVLRDTADAHVEHLTHLARERDVPIEVAPALPCRALALIDQQD